MGATEDEMVGWHPHLNREQLEETPGDSEGQGSLVYCRPSDHRVRLSLAAEQNNHGVTIYKVMFSNSLGEVVEINQIIFAQSYWLLNTKESIHFNAVNYIANLCHQLTFASRHCTCLHKSVSRQSPPPPSPPPLLIFIIKPNSTRFCFHWEQQSKFWALMIWNLGCNDLIWNE